MPSKKLIYHVETKNKILLGSSKRLCSGDIQIWKRDRASERLVDR
jgi:hypothetical protein